MITNLGSFGTGGGGEYVLPVATDSNLGGVKVGSGLSITSDGVLSSEGGAGKTIWKLTYDGSTLSGDEGLYEALSGYTDLSNFLVENEVIFDDVTVGITTIVSVLESEGHYLLEGPAAGINRMYLFVADGVTEFEYMRFVDTESFSDALAEKQDVLTAGEGISISGNTISATGGAGGDYKIVDELPLSAEDGTMVYLTADQPIYSKVSLSDGYVFDMPGVPDEVSYVTVAGAKHYVPEISIDEVQGEIKIDAGKPYMTSWFTSEEWYERDGRVNIMPTDWFTLVCMFDDTEKKYYTGIKDEREGYIFTITSGGEDYTGHAITEIPFIEGVIEKGQYIRKNGEWVAFELPVEPVKGGIPKVQSGELPDLETAADGGDVVAETYREDTEGEWVPTGDIVCTCDALPGESYYEWDRESEKISVSSVTINIQDGEFDSKWNQENMPNPGLYIAIDGAGDTLLYFEVLDGVLYCGQDGTCEGVEPVYAEAELNAGPVNVTGTFRSFCDDPSTEYTRTFSMEYMDGKVEITGLDSSTDFIVLYDGQKYNYVEEEGEMMFDSLRVANKRPNDWGEVQRNWDYIPTSANIKNIKFVSQSEFEVMSHDSNTLYLTWNDQA